MDAVASLVPVELKASAASVVSWAVMAATAFCMWGMEWGGTYSLLDMGVLIDSPNSLHRIFGPLHSVIEVRRYM